MDPKIHNRL